MPILNVEDYAPSRFLRSRILQRAGFTVIEEDTADAAVGKAVKGLPLPRLVLMDVGLPDGSGFDACERIKAARPTVPVVMISAVYRTTDSRRDAYAAGADAYLVEPVHADVLVKTVNQLAAAEHPGNEAAPGIVLTATDGRIVRVNPTAARMLNIGGRMTTPRNLLTFFNGGRAQLQTAVGLAAANQITQVVATIRPKERKPFKVTVDIAPVETPEGVTLEWTIEPVVD